MSEKPDFASMSLAELLAAYNETAINKRKAAWPNKEEGIRRAELEWTRHQAAVNNPPMPKVRRTRNDWPLKVTGDNPHRLGSRAHLFFEAMKESPTIGDYMRRYSTAEDVRDARIWLNVHRKGGRIDYQRPQ
jgi:hypothetical protein